MDVTQILLVFVISILTILLVVIGIQVVQIMMEIRKSLMKFNHMLDNASSVTDSISHTVTGAAGLVEGIKTGLSVINIFGRKSDEK